MQEHIHAQEARLHTRRRNKLGEDASPSSKLSINNGNIMSTTSHLLTETLKSASNRIRFSCKTGTAGLSLPS